MIAEAPPAERAPTRIACTNIGGMETFGECLTRHRQERGLTRAELADRVGVHTSTPWYWERDQAFPTYSHRHALREVLGVGVFEDRGWWAPQPGEACLHCHVSFNPMPTKPYHCSWQCVFKAMAAPQPHDGLTCFCLACSDRRQEAGLSPLVGVAL